MAIIIGHGPFAEYGRHIIIKGQMPLRQIIEELAISEELEDLLIPVIHSKIIEDDYPVRNEDEIHLFLQVSGG